MSSKKKKVRVKEVEEEVKDKEEKEKEEEQEQVIEEEMEKKEKKFKEKHKKEPKRKKSKIKQSYEEVKDKKKEEMDEEENESEEKDKKDPKRKKSKIRKINEEINDKNIEEMEEEKESKSGEDDNKGPKREKERVKNVEEEVKSREGELEKEQEEQMEKKDSESGEDDNALDEDDNDDYDDDMEMSLQYDSDGSIIDDDENCGVINYTSKQLDFEQKRKLHNLFIKLKHKVPPQHKIEKTAGTRALNAEEKEQFEKYAILRNGKYLPHEDNALKRNWRDFCNIHNWNIKESWPFLQMRYKNKINFVDFKERMKFIQFLANGLDNRSLYSVFNRFKVLYNPHKISRYSSREDETIINFIQGYKLSFRERDRKFAELASILKRTRASVWRRYRVLKKKHNLPDIKLI